MFFDDLASFPGTGTADLLYVARDTGKLYRWSGSAYVVVSDVPAHAASHADGGTDEITVAQSQVTGLAADLAGKAPLASPALTGTPTAPTAPPGTDSTQIATTAFVHTEASLLVPKALVDAKGDLLVATAPDTVARLPVGTDGQVLVADSAQTPGVKWATPSAGGSVVSTFLGGSGAVGGVTQNLMLPGVLISGTRGTRAYSANVLYYQWFQPTQNMTVTKLVLNNVSSAGTGGSTARIGIYATDRLLQPGALVVDAGDVAIDATGQKSITGLSASLTAGQLYLFAFHPSAAVTCSTFNGHLASGPITDGGQYVFQWSVSKTKAALADPGTAVTTVQGDNAIPMFYPVGIGAWS